MSVHITWSQSTAGEKERRCLCGGKEVSGGRKSPTRGLLAQEAKESSTRWKFCTSPTKHSFLCKLLTLTAFFFCHSSGPGSVGRPQPIHNTNNHLDLFSSCQSHPKNHLFDTVELIFYSLQQKLNKLAIAIESKIIFFIKFIYYYQIYQN